MKKLPVEPLTQWLQDHVSGFGTKARYSGGIHTVFNHSQYQSYYRAQKQGFLTEDAADKLAGALGMHPSEIW